MVRVWLHLPPITTRFVRVDFLLDTGADETCLHPADAIHRVGIDPVALASPHQWPQPTTFGGIGGSAIYYPHPAEYAFLHNNGQWQHLPGQVLIARPHGGNQTLESLLGWDVLQPRRRLVRYAPGGAGAMSLTFETAAPVGNDHFPSFSAAEYDRRYRMLREAMKAQGLDCLLIYGAYSFGSTEPGQINAVYLSGYVSCIHCYVIFPAEGEPTLVIALPTHVENAREISAIKDVRAHWRNMEVAVAQRLQELRIEDGKIGIVGPATTLLFNFTIPVEHHQHFTQALPRAEFCTVTNWFEHLRAVKSEEEIQHLERACAMTDVAYEEMIAATRPGVRHSELRHVVERVADRLGGQVPYIILSSTSMEHPEPYGLPDYWQTHHTVETGHIVRTKMGLSCGSYCGRVVGTYFVGEPARAYRDAFELAASVHQRVVDGLKPGMTGREVKRWAAPIEEAGYTTVYPLMMGYSVYNHPPQVGALAGSPAAGMEGPSDLEWVFQPGNCVNVIANIATPDLKRGLWVGSSCVFTESGLRQLNAYPPGTLRVV